MSKEQYNLSQQTNYLKRTMFLDPAGPVTVQRFEEVKYQKLQKYEETARGFFWVPEEISLTKDKMDHKDSNDAIKHIFTSDTIINNSSWFRIYCLIVLRTKYSSTDSFLYYNN